MRTKLMTSVFSIAFLTGSLTGFGATSAHADAAKPGQSMTHMKTAQGLSATLERAGITLYVQGGATAAVMGESIASANGQYVFHIPVTGTKTGVEHLGSNIVFFNSQNKKLVQLRNPVIDLKTGTVSAVIPQSSESSAPVLTITNAGQLKAKVVDDKKAKTRSSTYSGASLNLAPGIAAALASLLGLPAGSLPDGLNFGSADVTIYSKIPAKK